MPACRIRKLRPRPDWRSAPSARHWRAHDASSWRLTSSWKENEMLHIDEGQLHALLDEALDAGEADTVRQHIAACGECAVRYDDERAIRARANAILELAR